MIERALQLTRLGLEHIARGWDHLAFVLGLIWLAGTTRRLLVAVTMFTVAHSLTLAAATLEVVHLPGPPLEATIALSIAFLAVEVIQKERAGRPGLVAQKPWVGALSFGLLHGFGFASALTELEIPRAELPLALFCFNLGVELGQLAFIAAVLTVRPLVRCENRATEGRVAQIGSYALGSLAMFAFFERLAPFIRSV
jgi:hydrogenase/urease accessory protein HupE